MIQFWAMYGDVGRVTSCFVTSYSEVFCHYLNSHGGVEYPMLSNLSRFHNNHGSEGGIVIDSLRDDLSDPCSTQLLLLIQV